MKNIGAADNYTMEELWEAAGKLADKYTSKESTSVTYETARMLMEAVLYFIDEWEEAQAMPYAENRAVKVSGQKPALEEVCREGRRIAEEKVLKAKAAYEELIIGFEDYGCRNYRDTVIKGMPAFFTRYDVCFAPQEHLLALDYPLLCADPGLCGVDLILFYLERIKEEVNFLHHFPRDSVIRVLRSCREEYEELYLDNLCEPVLATAAGCLISDRSVGELCLSKEDHRIINTFFEGDSREKRKLKWKKIIRMVVDNMEDVKNKEYFLNCSFPAAFI